MDCKQLRMYMQPPSGRYEGDEVQANDPDLLALPFLSLTIKAIIEAPWAVTLAIALAIVEVSPALQSSRAVLPGIVKIERAVTSVPATGMVVAQRVTDVVTGPLITLGNLTAHLHFWRRCDVPSKPPDEGVVQYVAKEAIEVTGTTALEKGSIRGDLASASIVAGI